MSAATPVAWSVVVPTYERPERLARCVAALGAMKPPPGGFEVIIVNDGGREPGERARAAAAVGRAADVRFHRRENGGPGAARNTGAALARGRALAFTDDDCEPAPDWLARLDGTLARAPDSLIGGATVNGLEDNAFSETSQLLAGFVMEWFDGDGRERFFTSNNLAVARDAFLEVGGFDETFGLTGEDRELCDRWHAQGRPSVREPRALVRHFHELDLRAFLRQHFVYGVGARSFRAIRAEAGRRVRIDPRFYIESLRHARRERRGLRGVALAGWTVVAHAAYLTGLASATIQRRGEADDRRGTRFPRAEAEPR